ncbi:coiled-coil protein [Candidatus Desulfofervidus auxilii]|uniref:Coiled-coil protein n=2 Tax=Desulfofervidus auxilii TaxID=1621989 RepID=A0A7U4QJN0_DESA2|nr:coiled-coil protein [Candidatus Desulfofervidus auxilii]
MCIGVRSMDKEGVVTAIKHFILPELKEIKHNQAKMSIRLDAVEKRLSDINGHLVDQSRRIDETNNRIDEVRTELTGRIDATNNRIDQLTFQVGKIAQEMERIKREESVTSDILTRLRALEQKTANL